MENEKPIYELEERTFQFAKRTRIWLKDLHRKLAIIEDSKTTCSVKRFCGCQLY